MMEHLSTSYTEWVLAYQLPGLANKLYSLFRHGIAHNSLAKGGVFVNKTGDPAFHLSDNGNNLDIKIMFEDFKKTYDGLFSSYLIDQATSPTMKII